VLLPTDRLLPASGQQRQQQQQHLRDSRPFAAVSVALCKLPNPIRGGADRIRPPLPHH